MVARLVIAIAQEDFHVGAVEANRDKIIRLSRQARNEMAADVIVFPELCLTGYPPEDLLLRADFLKQVDKAVDEITAAVHDIGVLIGHPRAGRAKLFNSASFLFNGHCLGVYDKFELPNYLVFDEQRYFSPGSKATVVAFKEFSLGLTICEDLWTGPSFQYSVDAGAELIININASPYHTSKRYMRENLLKSRSRTLNCPILYANTVGGQDELVFDGASLICSADARIVGAYPEFQDGLFKAVFEKTSDGCVEVIESETVAPLEEIAAIYQALVRGVRDYVVKSGFQKVVVGLSGGIDSALVLALAADALGAGHVEAVMMPSRYTSDMSLYDAQAIAAALSVSYHTVSIESMYRAFITELAELLQLDPDNPRHVAAENIQARSRGVILMAMANRNNALVLATGNKSEMAVGYATLYGDMAGAFAPIKDVKKTRVYELARYRNTFGQVIPERVMTRAPSAELAPDQKDQDTLPDYQLLDQILEGYVECDESPQNLVDRGLPEEAVRKVVKLVMQNEYKRRQAAPGVRVTKRAFGKDRRYPIVNGFKIDLESK